MNFRKKSYKRIFIITAIFLFIAIIMYWQYNNVMELNGNTMGTQYRVSIVSHKFYLKSKVREKIGSVLSEVNQAFSTYDPTSEISQINLANHTQPIRVSSHFFFLLKEVKTLNSLTQGAFDPTVQPLVRLWGFFDQDQPFKFPSDTEIQQTMAWVGLDKLRLVSPNQVQKLTPKLELDLSAIAKGYGVDQVIKALHQEFGFENLMVEIGGEIRVMGHNRFGDSWSVGVNTPKPNLPFNTIFSKRHLVDEAIATSGTYRQYFLANGDVYSHIIDPLTGGPIFTHSVSASVIAPTCAQADGLATALMVLPVSLGISLVNNLDNVEAMIIQKDPQTQSLESVASLGW